MVTRAAWVVLGVLGPALAGAAEQPSNMIVSFDKGATAELFGLVYKLAFGLFVFALIVALFLEFLNPPDQGPQFVKVGVRAVGIMVALLLYPTLAGTVVKSLNGLAAKVAPSQLALWEYTRRLAVAERKATANPNGLPATTTGATGVSGGVQYGDAGKGAAPGAPPRPSTPCPSGFSYELGVDGNAMVWKCVADYAAPSWSDEGGIGASLRRAVMGSGLSLIFVFLDAMKFIVEQLGAVLTAIFYILGPLALVAGLPRASGTAGNWFRHFVTYASWPVFTNLVLQLVIAIAVKSATEDVGYADTLFAALASAASFASVPMLAGQIIGVAGSGFVSGAAGAAIGAAMGGHRAVAGMSGAGQGAAATATGAAVAGALLGNPAMVAAVSKLAGGMDAGGAAGGGAPPGNKPGS